ncbi:hypothetical protein CPB84DRAFT_1964450 [Gymnopilus junonius]|uniref:DUF6533 domain-containing protein n=1 Tax=Gymnopilus junonius TaxID=109634 RepID=A0A9P5NJG9_GYMJU|nr:hypothetical protein CPB84DRAFT_1964450 [Gymnopilus junonius]
MLIYDGEFRIASNVMVASMTVLIFDYLITFPEEFRAIWNQKISKINVLFLLNRYIPFIDTTMALISTFSYMSLHVNFPRSFDFHCSKELILPRQRCRSFYITSTWLIAFGLMVSELILLLRTWLLWQKSKKILWFLGLMSAATFFPGIAVTVKEVVSFECMGNSLFSFVYAPVLNVYCAPVEPVPEGAVGCRLVRSNKLIAVAYILIAISETTVVGLTIMKGGWDRFNSKAKFVRNVYRHGLLFYLYLLIITIANIIVPFMVHQPSYKIYLAVPQRVFHSILCNHVVLYIQSQKTVVDVPLEELTRSGSVFKTNHTGNIVETGRPPTLHSRELESRDSRWQIDEEDLDGNEHEMSLYRNDQWPS